MVALLREHPSVKVTVNLVPSLLVQLEAFAREDARDRHLQIGLKPAADLSADERTFCVTEFFHAHRGRMIEPHPRYRELAALRDEGDAPDLQTRAARFTVEDIRDLQVWQKLVWIDHEYWESDARVRALVAKGRGYSEQDKVILRAVELEILRAVVPEYAAAAARGQVELSTSPFYHPILPLLCDSDVHLRAHPGASRPRRPFRHPADAADQLARAVRYHQERFGAPPRGLWPSEGSVSDAMVPLVAAAGLQWMASDEGILARTCGWQMTRDGHGHLDAPEQLYQPFRIGTEQGGSVACGFRDRRLSDLIGFTYASWPAAHAADDFVARLVEGGRRYAHRTGGGEATVFVVLDGENAWETYEGQGRPFLRALYERLETHPELRTVTMSEACASPSETLQSIFPGSWINEDFYIWIGHPDDHRAWDQLGAAREVLEHDAGIVTTEQWLRAREELLIAEGSDWFWWYGDDHSSAHDQAFDTLFRRHVRNVYTALGRPVPEELFTTNISTGERSLVDAPEGPLTPTLDGEVTSFFEWLGAGEVDLRVTAGAMHEATNGAQVQRLLFGHDRHTLYVRVDTGTPITELLRRGLRLEIVFQSPVEGAVSARWDPTTGRVDAEFVSEPPGLAREGIRTAAGRILEVAIPFDALGAGSGALVAFMLRAPGQSWEKARPAMVRVP
jgi:alpha-amylase/alpha-mannosidase (GH57 family)